jgi:hypothetical protein
MDRNEKMVGMVVTVKADVQVTGYKSRPFTLNIDYSDCSLDDVLRKAAAEERITWQNGHRSKGEDHMSLLPAVINIRAKPPGVRGVVDVEAAYMTKLATADIDKLDAEVKKIEAIIAARKAAKIGPKPGQGQDISESGLREYKIGPKPGRESK